MVWDFRKQKENFVTPRQTITLPSRPSGGRTGVSTGPLREDIPGPTGRRTGGPTMPEQPKPGPGLMDTIREQYGNLSNELMRLRDQYAKDIERSTGSTVSYLEGVDPTAAYRVTTPTLEAPIASASSYLQAIGADPAQVAAQRDYLNQMMASQTAGQNDYSRAIDESSRAYRQAQMAEVFRNAAEAQSGLNAATLGQRAAIGMRQLEAEQAVKQALLEYQLAIMTQQGKTGAAPNYIGLPYGNLTGIQF